MDHRRGSGPPPEKRSLLRDPVLLLPSLQVVAAGGTEVGEIYWFVLTVFLTQITQEDSLSEELSRSSWSGHMSVKDCLDY